MDATIRGIQFDVRRATDVPDMAVDYSVRITRDGQAAGSDHKQMGNWPSALAYGTYGGPTGTRDAQWAPADLMNSQFGLSIAAPITYTKGNCQ